MMQTYFKKNQEYSLEELACLQISERLVNRRIWTYENAVSKYRVTTQEYGERHEVVRIERRALYAKGPEDVSSFVAVHHPKGLDVIARRAGL